MIIYRYNDLANILVYYYFKRNNLASHYYYFKPASNINFIGSSLNAILYTHFPIDIAAVFFVAFYIILSFIFTILLFKKLTLKNRFSWIYSLLFSLSTYMIYRVISLSFELCLVFLFTTVFISLVKGIKPFIVGTLVLFNFVLSNYYGFFSFVLVCFWYLFDLISKKINFKEFLKNIVLFTIPILLGITVFFFPLLKSNLPFLGDYTKEQSQKPASERTTVYRPIEDWYNLSFRPWYFFIPPKSSVFFGEFSKNIHKKIESTNYYLADDYMEEEMAGSYMGWHFLIGIGTVAVILLLKKYKNIEYKTFQNVYKNKEIIIRSFFIIFCILLISGPPSFTISGVEIYTPTYLLYYIVPVFRTLVRWAVVIYLFVLIINSFLVQDLYNLMKTKFQKILFILSFLTLNFVIFAIKIPVININKPPQEIAFVKEKYPESVPYAVYPKGDYYSIFWIISHEDLLINPVNFINYETGFDSNEFSKNLITEEGIREFLDKDPKYLIYYPENISDDDLEKIAEINPSLKSRENIYEFFRSNFGDGVVVGESVVFEINR